MLKKENHVEDEIQHVETVEVNTATDKLEDIISQLEPEKQYEGNGYAGLLSLDIATIQCEPAGYKKSTYNLTETIPHPGQSANDTSNIPKNITLKGTTYTLDDVDFKPQDTDLIDYESVPRSYTAYAIYKATVSSTKVTGYVTTAQYKGLVSKTVLDKTLYNVVFISNEPVIEEPLEEIIVPEPEADENNEADKGIASGLPDVFLPIFLTLLTIAAVAGVSILLLILFNLYNVTVYCQDGTGFKRIGRIKLKYKKEEPVIDLAVVRAKSKIPLTSNTYVVELSAKATKDLTGQEVIVRHGEKEINHVIETGHGFRRYQFEVNFDD